MFQNLNLGNALNGLEALFVVCKVTVKARGVLESLHYFLFIYYDAFFPLLILNRV